MTKGNPKNLFMNSYKVLYLEYPNFKLKQVVYDMQYNLTNLALSKTKGWWIIGMFGLLDCTEKFKINITTGTKIIIMAIFYNLK